MNDQPASTDRAPDGIAPGFLAGGGDTGALMRGLDWSANPLGPPGGWPQALKTLVAVMLNSNQPMFVAWGPERIMLYNDGYAPMTGQRHPAAMGRTFAEVWFDIMDVVGPILDRAYAGVSTHSEDIQFTMLRHGYPEETHFSFSYTPVPDETGSVTGMFCVCAEITERVFADRRRQFLLALSDRLRPLGDPDEVMAAASEALGRHLSVGRCGYGEVDATGELFTVERDWTDDTMPSLAGTVRIADFGPEILTTYRAGKVVVLEDQLSDPRTRDATAAHEAAGRIRAGIGVPLVKNGRFVAAFYVHQTVPRRWTAEDETIVRSVAERTWAAVERARAETALRESEARFRTLAEGIEDVFYLSQIDAARLVYISPAYERIWGRPAADLMEGRIAFLETIHPDDHPQVLAGNAAQERGEPAVIEYRIRRPDGSLRWILDRSFPVPGFGRRRSAGVASDVTDRKRAEAALGASETRLRHIFEGVTEYAIVTLGADRSILGWNVGAERILGYSEAEALSRSADMFFTPEDRAAGKPAEEVRTARETGTASDERWHMRKDGSRFWGSGVMQPIEGGQADAFIKIFRDRTEERHAEDRRQLLIHELNHRVKNTLATVQAVAAQSFRQGNVAQSAIRGFEFRLRALAGAHDVLTRESWERAELGEIAAAAVGPFRPDGADRIGLAGPRLYMMPKPALALAMALHELATNAIKYGALSNETGRVRISWAVEGDPGRLRLFWRESGGPPVAPPQHRGFGSRLIERGLATDLGGDARIEFDPEGVTCEISAPIENLRIRAD